MKQFNFQSRFLILLLGFLTIGISQAWGAEVITIYSENFGSVSSAKEYNAHTDYSADAKMFTDVTKTVASHYIGSGKIGKNSADVSSGYTGASGKSAAYHQGVANTQATILTISEINIKNYKSLTLSFGAKGGSTDHKVDVTYSIDGGEETSLI